LGKDIAYCWINFQKKTDTAEIDASVYSHKILNNIEFLSFV